MAALTSTQSGNFSSSSTWGGSAPADGDTFTITAGHLVTVNTDLRPTNGYGDIECHGKLYITNNGKLRINGRITVRASGKTSFFTDGVSTSGGAFVMDSNSRLEIRGDNSAQHGIWNETERYTTLECVGSEKNRNTTLSVEHTYNSDYFSVASAANFAAEDWLTVFKRDSDYIVCTDEGFWVHDVDTSNNRIYYRQFVSPTAQVTSYNSSDLYVDNARKFKVGYKIIFGTGSNRNVKTITAIDKGANKITCDTLITGDPTGFTVYQTGNEKIHVSGSIVKRMATTLTSFAGSGGNEIQVGNASDINVGDEILIDVNNDNQTGWDYNAKYTISAKEGNSLTLSSNLSSDHKAGSIVTIVSRDCEIHAVDTSSNTRPFIYIEGWTSSDGYDRRVRFQNVHFNGIGTNTSSTFYAGVFVYGYTGIYREGDSRHQYESRIDSCVYDSPNHNSTYGSIYLRETRYFVLRNNVSYRNERGYWIYSSNYDLKITNNYATRTYYSGFSIDSIYQPYCEVSYNYATRTDDYGMLISQHRELYTIRHNIFLNNENRGFYMFYVMPAGTVIERLYQDGYRYPPHNSTVGGAIIYLDSQIQPNRWDGSAEGGSGQVYSDYINAVTTDDRHQYWRTGGYSGLATYLDWGFEEGKVAQTGTGGIRVWDETEKYWDVQVAGDDTYGGWFETVYVPPNTKAFVSCDVQCVSGFTGTRPVLFAKSHRGSIKMGRYEPDYLGYTSTQSSTSTSAKRAGSLGFLESVRYSSASHGAWESQTLTVQGQPMGYYLICGVYCDNTNIREEGFKMRDIKIYMEQGYGAPIGAVRQQQSSTGIRANATTPKRRIGGRIG